MTAALGDGLCRWHTEDFTSVVVTGKALVASGDPERQARAWLDAAIAVCRLLLQR